MSSGESELIAAVNGLCETAGLLLQWKFVRQTIDISENATEPWHIIMTDSAAALGFLHKKGNSCRTRHVEGKSVFL